MVIASRADEGKQGNLFVKGIAALTLAMTNCAS
jgi:hypothetical protein